MISLLVTESRLPVGSSARISGGTLTSARAIATRCCCPPESWFGVWSSRLSSPTSVEHLARPLCAALDARAVVHHRQLDVLQRAGARQQIEPLKHKPDPLVADMRPAASALSEPTSCPSSKYLPARRPIETAEDVHKSRLARARCAHHRDKLAVRDRQIDAAQRRHLDVAHAISFVDIFDADQLAHRKPGRGWAGWNGLIGPA